SNLARCHRHFRALFLLASSILFWHVPRTICRPGRRPKRSKPTLSFEPTKRNKKEEDHTMRDLTALEVNALRHKLGTHRVAANLYLKVREARRGGTRASWVFRYERGTADKRKGKHLGLGSMTDFTYAEAKERARRQRQLLADKIDPLEQK